MDAGTLATYLGTGLAAFFIVLAIVFKAVSKQYTMVQKSIDSEDETTPGVKRLVLNMTDKQDKMVAAVNEMTNKQNLLALDFAHEISNRKMWQEETRKRFDDIENETRRRFDGVDNCVKEMTSKVNKHETDIAVLNERNDIVRALEMLRQNGNGEG